VPYRFINQPASTSHLIAALKGERLMCVARDRSELRGGLGLRCSASHPAHLLAACCPLQSRPN